jgi:hypothetical protein
VSTQSQLVKTAQTVARLEQKLAQEKLKQRKQDARKKIELGGLVIKAKMDNYSKAVILGALMDAVTQLNNNADVKALFQAKGEAAFMGYSE